MRTVLICHAESRIDRIGLARWLASWSDLAGIVELRETGERKRRRFMREFERVGAARFIDVLAFRLYYKARLAKPDARWEQRTLEDLATRFPDTRDRPAPRVLTTPSPNTPEAEAFIRELAPDVMVARCKTLLAQRVFSIPRVGTFVMHPGVCPEYRNAHGGFWALANDDLDKVGVTLLKIDKGVDTGPVYGYYTYPYDEVRESPLVIQQRCLFENLDAVRNTLVDIAAGVARPIDTRGRPSGEWGQPWITRYLRWKRQARARRAERATARPTSAALPGTE
ncbi:MAG TPA: formyltransferase family protein [Gemmatirosa sp.]